MHLHNCWCFQKHLWMLLQSLRALCFAPGRPSSIWKYFEALVRSTGVSGRFGCGFRSNLHFANVCGQIELCHSYWVYCAITSSGHCFSHIIRRPVFYIISGQVISVIRWLTRFGSHCRADEIDTQHCFEFNDRQRPMFGTQFIPHICLKALLVLGSTWSYVFTINIHSYVTRPEQSHLPERNKVNFYIDMHSRCQSHFSTLFWQRLACSHGSKVQVFIPFSLVHS